MRWFWPVLWGVQTLVATALFIGSLMHRGPVPSIVYLAVVMVMADEFQDSYNQATTADPVRSGHAGAQRSSHGEVGQ